MRFMEFGKSNKKTMLLIHGMQTPWQIWDGHIEYFSKQYHVIVPILSGHDTEEASTFISVYQEAKTIEDFLVQHNKNNIAVICGISLGGVISTLLWERGNVRIDNMILDGAPLLRHSKLISFFILKQYKYLTLKTKKRDFKVLEKCKNKFIPAKYMEYFLSIIDTMSDETITNCVNSIGSFQLPSNLNAKEMNIAYYYGTKLTEYYSKKSAKYLGKFYPKIDLHCFNGYEHGELFLFHPDDHIQAIESFLHMSCEK